MSKYELDMGATPIEGHVAGGPQIIKCLACVSEHIQAKTKFPGSDPLPINDAITWAASWQQQSMLGQNFMACIALPSCMQHLDVNEKTPQQRAAERGIIIGGNG